ncbi:MAG: ferredoxin, partial [Nitrososphaeraceae archaeon]|nr:ferredoxin [Nitrososphaeraceae archaeon]
MSLLLKDRVWIVLSEVTKRGVYPLHGYKLGLFRLPVDLTDSAIIASISNDLRTSGFKLDKFADRIFVSSSWKEDGYDNIIKKNLSADLSITVEIVTGEVTDIIYEIKPIEYFGDLYWVKNYKKNADLHAKIIIDTIVRNTVIGDRLIAHIEKTEKLTRKESILKLEALTPLAKNPKTRDDKPVITQPKSTVAEIQEKENLSVSSESVGSDLSSGTTISLTGSGVNYSVLEGPIDASFKSKRQVSGKFKNVSVWGPIDAPGKLGVWGDNVCVDFDICI